MPAAMLFTMSTTCKYCLAVLSSCIPAKKKLAAVVTAACFVFTSIIAQPALAVVEQKREDRRLEKIFRTDIIPSSAGRVTSAFDRGSGRVAVIIQDLHCHEEVQRNIARILEIIDGRWGLKKVYVEGASGELDTSWTNRIRNEKVREVLIEGLIKRGNLTGAEYYSMRSGKPDMLCGLENDAAYRENLLRLEKITESQEHVESVLSAMREELETMKSRHLSRETRRFDSFRKKYRGGKLPSEKYHRLLEKYESRLGLSHKESFGYEAYPALAGYRGLLEEGRGLQWKRVSRELQDFLNAAKGRLPYAVYQRIMKETDSFTRADELYGYLGGLVKEYNLSTDPFPELGKFLRYMEHSRNVNPLGVVREERRLAYAIEYSLARDEAERRVLFLNDYFAIAEDYLKGKLSGDDHEYFRGHYDEFRLRWKQYADQDRFSELAEEWRLCDEYYRVNAQRNTFFVNAVVRAPSHLAGEGRDEGKAGRAAEARPYATSSYGNRSAETILDQSKEIVGVIAGGFHTEELAKLLSEKGINTITITPNVTTGAGEAEQIYRSLICSQARVLNQALGPMVEAMLIKLLNDKDRRADIRPEVTKILVEAVAEVILGDIEPSERQSAINESLRALFGDGINDVRILQDKTSRDITVQIGFKDNETLTLKFDDKGKPREAVRVTADGPSVPLPRAGTLNVRDAEGNAVPLEVRDLRLMGEAERKETAAKLREWYAFEGMSVKYGAFIDKILKALEDPKYYEESFKDDPHETTPYIAVGPDGSIEGVFQFGMFKQGNAYIRLLQYLEVAPWNRDNGDKERKYSGTGSRFIAFALERFQDPDNPGHWTYPVYFYLPSDETKNLFKDCGPEEGEAPKWQREGFDKLAVQQPVFEKFMEKQRQRTLSQEQITENGTAGASPRSLSILGGKRQELLEQGKRSLDALDNLRDRFFFIAGEPLLGAPAIETAYLAGLRYAIAAAAAAAGLDPASVTFISIFLASFIFTISHLDQWEKGISRKEFVIRSANRLAGGILLTSLLGIVPGDWGWAGGMILSGAMHSLWNVWVLEEFPGHRLLRPLIIDAHERLQKHASSSPENYSDAAMKASGAQRVYIVRDLSDINGRELRVALKRGDLIGITLKDARRGRTRETIKTIGDSIRDFALMAGPLLDLRHDQQWYVEYCLKEMLKNGAVHGNRLKLDKPLFFRFFRVGRSHCILERITCNLPGEDAELMRESENSTILSGHGAAAAMMQPDLLPDYAKYPVPFKAGSAAPVFNTRYSLNTNADYGGNPLTIERVEFDLRDSRTNTEGTESRIGALLKVLDKPGHDKTIVERRKALLTMLVEREQKRLKDAMRLSFLANGFRHSRKTIDEHLNEYVSQLPLGDIETLCACAWGSTYLHQTDDNYFQALSNYTHARGDDTPLVLFTFLDADRRTARADEDWNAFKKEVLQRGIPAKILDLSKGSPAGRDLKGYQEPGIFIINLGAQPRHAYSAMAAVSDPNIPGFDKADTGPVASSAVVRQWVREIAEEKNATNRRNRIIALVRLNGTATPGLIDFLRETKEPEIISVISELLLHTEDINRQIGDLSAVPALQEIYFTTADEAKKEAVKKVLHKLMTECFDTVLDKNRVVHRTTVEKRFSNIYPVLRKYMLEALGGRAGRITDLGASVGPGTLELWEIASGEESDAKPLPVEVIGIDATMVLYQVDFGDARCIFDAEMNLISYHVKSESKQDKPGKDEQRSVENACRKILTDLMINRELPDAPVITKDGIAPWSRRAGENGEAEVSAIFLLHPDAISAAARHDIQFRQLNFQKQELPRSRMFTIFNALGGYHLYSNNATTLKTLRHVGQYLEEGGILFIGNNFAEPGAKMSYAAYQRRGDYLKLCDKWTPGSYLRYEGDDRDEPRVEDKDGPWPLISLNSGSDDGSQDVYEPSEDRSRPGPAEPRFIIRQWVDDMAREPGGKESLMNVFKNLSGAATDELTQYLSETNRPEVMTTIARILQETRDENGNEGDLSSIPALQHIYFSTNNAKKKEIVAALLHELNTYHGYITTRLPDRDPSQDIARTTTDDRLAETETEEKQLAASILGNKHASIAPLWEWIYALPFSSYLAGTTVISRLISRLTNNEERGVKQTGMAVKIADTAGSLALLAGIAAYMTGIPAGEMLSAVLFTLYLVSRGIVFGDAHTLQDTKGKIIVGIAGIIFAEFAALPIAFSAGAGIFSGLGILTLPVAILAAAAGIGLSSYVHSGFNRFFARWFNLPRAEINGENTARLSQYGMAESRVSGGNEVVRRFYGKIKGNDGAHIPVPLELVDIEACDPGLRSMYADALDAWRSKEKNIAYIQKIIRDPREKVKPDEKVFLAVTRSHDDVPAIEAAAHLKGIRSGRPMAPIVVIRSIEVAPWNNDETTGPHPSLEDIEPQFIHQLFAFIRNQEAYKEIPLDILKNYLIFFLPARGGIFKRMESLFKKYRNDNKAFTFIIFRNIPNTPLRFDNHYLISGPVFENFMRSMEEEQKELEAANYRAVLPTAAPASGIPSDQAKKNILRDLLNNRPRAMNRNAALVKSDPVPMHSNKIVEQFVRERYRLDKIIEIIPDIHTARNNYEGLSTAIENAVLSNSAMGIYLSRLENDYTIRSEHYAIDEDGVAMYDSISDLFIKSPCMVDEKAGDKLCDGFRDLLPEESRLTPSYALYEMLKNAYVHGIKCDMHHGIYVIVDDSKRAMSVIQYDAKTGDEKKIHAAKEAVLHGNGVGEDYLYGKNAYMISDLPLNTSYRRFTENVNGVDVTIAEFSFGIDSTKCMRDERASRQGLFAFFPAGFLPLLSQTDLSLQPLMAGATKMATAIALAYLITGIFRRAGFFSGKAQVAGRPYTGISALGPTGAVVTGIISTGLHIVAGMAGIMVLTVDESDPNLEIREPLLSKPSAMIQLRRAVKLLAAQKEARGGAVIELPAHKEMLLVGDIHTRKGNIDAVLRTNDNLKKIKEGKAVLVFAGDLLHSEHEVTEMISSLSTLQYLLQLKLDYPEGVYFLNGNHEYLDRRAGERGGVSQSKLFQDEMRLIYGEEYVALYRELIGNGAIMAKGPGILVHGGPSRHARNLGDVRNADVSNFRDVIVNEILTGRPRTSARKEGYTSDDVRDFMRRMGMPDGYFFVGHTPGDEDNFHWQPDQQYDRFHVIFGANETAGFVSIREGEPPRFVKALQYGERPRSLKSNYSVLKKEYMKQLEKLRERQKGERFQGDDGKASVLGGEYASIAPYWEWIYALPFSMFLAKSAAAKLFIGWLSRDGVAPEDIEARIGEGRYPRLLKAVDAAVSLAAAGTVISAMIGVPAEPSFIIAVGALFVLSRGVIFAAAHKWTENTLQKMILGIVGGMLSFTAYCAAAGVYSLSGLPLPGAAGAAFLAGTAANIVLHAAYNYLADRTSLPEARVISPRASVTQKFSSDHYRNIYERNFRHRRFLRPMNTARDIERLHRECQQKGYSAGQIRTVAERTITLYDYLRQLPNIAENGGISLGIDDRFHMYKVFTELSGLESWREAYDRLFDGDMRERTDSFLDAITKEAAEKNRNIVFFLPADIFAHGASGVTARELEWFMRHPDRADHVLFVTVYDLIAPEMRERLRLVPDENEDIDEWEGRYGSAGNSRSNEEIRELWKLVLENYPAHIQAAPPTPGTFPAALPAERKEYPFAASILGEAYSSIAPYWESIYVLPFSMFLAKSGPVKWGIKRLDGSIDDGFIEAGIGESRNPVILKTFDAFSSFIMAGTVLSALAGIPAGLPVLIAAGTVFIISRGVIFSAAHKWAAEPGTMVSSNQIKLGALGTLFALATVMSGLLALGAFPFQGQEIFAAVITISAVLGGLALSIALHWGANSEWGNNLGFPTATIFSEPPALTSGYIENIVRMIKSSRYDELHKEIEKNRADFASAIAWIIVDVEDRCFVRNTVIESVFPLDDDLSAAFFAALDESIALESAETLGEPLTLQENDRARRELILKAMATLIEMDVDKAKERGQQIRTADEVPQSVKNVLNSAFRNLIRKHVDELNKDNNHSGFFPVILAVSVLYFIAFLRDSIALEWLASLPFAALISPSMSRASRPFENKKISGMPQNARELLRRLVSGNFYVSKPAVAELGSISREQVRELIDLVDGDNYATLNRSLQKASRYDCIGILREIYETYPSEDLRHKLAGSVLNDYVIRKIATRSPNEFSDESRPDKPNSDIFRMTSAERLNPVWDFINQYFKGQRVHVVDAGCSAGPADLKGLPLLPAGSRITGFDINMDCQYVSDAGGGSAIFDYSGNPLWARDSKGNMWVREEGMEKGRLNEKSVDGLKRIKDELSVNLSDEVTAWTDSNGNSIETFSLLSAEAALASAENPALKFIKGDFLVPLEDQIAEKADVVVVMNAIGPRWRYYDQTDTLHTLANLRTGLREGGIIIAGNNITPYNEGMGFMVLQRQGNKLKIIHEQGKSGLWAGENVREIIIPSGTASVGEIKDINERLSDDWIYVRRMADGKGIPEKLRLATYEEIMDNDILKERIYSSLVYRWGEYRGNEMGSFYYRALISALRSDEYPKKISDKLKFPRKIGGASVSCVFALSDDDEVQGFIEYGPRDDGGIAVYYVEIAPWNLHQERAEGKGIDVYTGVGGQLFVHAINKAYDGTGARHKGSENKSGIFFTMPSEDTMRVFLTEPSDWIKEKERKTVYWYLPEEKIVAFISSQQDYTREWNEEKQRSGSLSPDDLKEAQRHPAVPEVDAIQMLGRGDALAQISKSFALLPVFLPLHIQGTALADNPFILKGAAVFAAVVIALMVMSQGQSVMWPSVGRKRLPVDDDPQLKWLTRKFVLHAFLPENKEEVRERVKKLTAATAHRGTIHWGITLLTDSSITEYSSVARCFVKWKGELVKVELMVSKSLPRGTIYLSADGVKIEEEEAMEFLAAASREAAGVFGNDRYARESKAADGIWDIVTGEAGNLRRGAVVFWDYDLPSRGFDAALSLDADPGDALIKIAAATELIHAESVMKPVRTIKQIFVNKPHAAVVSVGRAPGQSYGAVLLSGRPADVMKFIKDNQNLLKRTRETGVQIFAEFQITEMKDLEEVNQPGTLAGIVLEGMVIDLTNAANIGRTECDQQLKRIRDANRNAVYLALKGTDRTDIGGFAAVHTMPEKISSAMYSGAGENDAYELYAHADMREITAETYIHDTVQKLNTAKNIIIPAPYEKIFLFIPTIIREMNAYFAASPSESFDKEKQRAFAIETAVSADDTEAWEAIKDVYALTEDDGNNGTRVVREGAMERFIKQGKLLARGLKDQYPALAMRTAQLFDSLETPDADEQRLNAAAAAGWVFGMAGSVWLRDAEERMGTSAGFSASEMDNVFVSIVVDRAIACDGKLESIPQDPGEIERLVRDLYLLGREDDMPKAVANMEGGAGVALISKVERETRNPPAPLKEEAISDPATLEDVLARIHYLANAGMSYEETCRQVRILVRQALVIWNRTGHDDAAASTLFQILAFTDRRLSIGRVNKAPVDTQYLYHAILSAA